MSLMAKGDKQLLLKTFLHFIINLVLKLKSTILRMKFDMASIAIIHFAKLFLVKVKMHIKRVKSKITFLDLR